MTGCDGLHPMCRFFFYRARVGKLPETGLEPVTTRHSKACAEARDAETAP